MSEFKPHIKDPNKEQSTKDLKNTSPMPQDPSLAPFVKGDRVLIDAKSRSNQRHLKGEFYFDTYDDWDNTCFISEDVPPKKPHMGMMCWNVSLEDLTKVIRLGVAQLNKKARKSDIAPEDITFDHIKAEWMDFKHNQKIKLSDFVGKSNVTIIYEEGKTKKVLQ